MPGQEALSSGGGSVPHRKKLNLPTSSLGPDWKTAKIKGGLES